MTDPDLRDRVIDALRGLHTDTARVGMIRRAVVAGGRRASRREVREQCDELVEAGVLAVPPETADDTRQYRLTRDT